MTALSLAYLNNPDTAEALAFGYGLPPAPILVELQSLWQRLHAQGVRLPAERRIIVINGCSTMTARHLTRTQRNLYWGLVIGDHRLKRWKGGQWSVEFLLDGYPCGGGGGINPRTVKALVRAGWIDRDGRPIRHEIEAPNNA